MMSGAIGSRAPLLLQQASHRRCFQSSTCKPKRVWINRTAYATKIRCKADVTTPAAAAPAAVPAASYLQPPAPQNEYVAQTEQPALAPQARPQEYYMAAPPPPMYPAPVYREVQQPAAGLPWFIWVGVGILVATGFQKVSEVMKKGPQQVMAEMAMKQMMSAMSQQQGGAGGASPFGAAGSPFGGAAGSPFGAGGANPYAANPYANFSPPSSAAVDTTATTMPPTPQQTPSAPSPPPTPSSSASSSGRGDKFSQRITQEGRAPDGTPLDVVEAEVKEPPPMGSPTPSSSSPQKASFFQDVDTTSVPPTPPPSSPFNAASAASASPASSAPGGAAGGAAAGDSSAVTVMMEKMLRNPEMQKMLYPYLPEPMRNPQSIEWMLDNPEVKAQMEKMLTDQGFNMPPQMVDMMQNMDLSEDKVNRQFQELGLKPEDVMQKVMSSPELSNGFSNPKVQQAIMDISSNPMNIVKYQSDPEVMKVLEKVNEIFAPGMGGMPGGGMGGMPPGMPGMPGMGPPGN